ncbi:ATP-binding protein [Parvularcula marina]|uniref:ATP-binding protein n=1 Tax=Parvularcula marina TaxID=2292771 RepID=UPI003516650D
MIRRASFAAQMAVVLAIALLAAQAVNFFFLLEARERVRTAREDTQIERFVAGAENDQALQRIKDRPRRRRVPVSVTNAPLATLGDVDEKLTLRLQEKLREAGLNADGAMAARMMRPMREGEELAIVLSSAIEGGQWFNAVSPAPQGGSLDVKPLILQTVLIYIGLMAAVLLVTARLARPLRRLTDAANRFQLDSQDIALTEEGPSDIRSLTAAFDQMRGRLRRAFTEKDAMLGAIGHDLRTPLTSLRIRVEQVEDDQLRERMITSIDELSTMLEDILILARDGAPGTEREALDLSSLCRQLADDMGTGDRKVAFDDDAPLVTPVYPALLKRALRNLIQNGLRYGGDVTLCLQNEESGILIAVDDDGPGVPEAQLDALREPFRRGEGSRNRETGGAGLGLAIADGAARAHGGQLELSNRAEGGFRAGIRLPAHPSPH